MFAGSKGSAKIRLKSGGNELPAQKCDVLRGNPAADDFAMLEASR